MEATDRFVLLGRVGDSAHARILAARLASEGIDTRVRSEASGPYVFSVGEMAVAELWVTQRDLDAARRIMLEADVDEVLGAASLYQEGSSWSPGARWMAAIVAAVIFGLWLRRFLLVVM